MVFIKKILVALECCDSEFLQKVDTPNLDSMESGVHPAYSPGVTTRAAVAAFMGGILPDCIVKDCSYHKFRWTNPFFMTDLKKKTNLYVGCPNGWALELLVPYMSEELKKKNLYWMESHQYLPSEMILDDFESRDYDDYFMYLHVQENHPPYFHPDWKGVKPGDINKRDDIPEPPERRKMAVEWVDREIIGRILDYDFDQLVVCGDHALEHNVPQVHIDSPRDDEVESSTVVRDMQSTRELPIGHSLRSFIASENRKEDKYHGENY